MKLNPKIKWGLGLGLAAVLAVNYNSSLVKDSEIGAVRSANRSPQSATPSSAVPSAVPSASSIASAPSPTPRASNPTLSLIDQTTLDLKGRPDFVELVDVQLKRNGNQVNENHCTGHQGHFR